jgi:hypothetical protein
MRAGSSATLGHLAWNMPKSRGSVVFHAYGLRECARGSLDEDLEGEASQWKARPPARFIDRISQPRHSERGGGEGVGRSKELGEMVCPFITTDTMMAFNPVDGDLELREGFAMSFS